MKKDYQVTRHPDGHRWVVIGDGGRIVEVFETRDAARAFTGRKPGRGPRVTAPTERSDDARTSG